MHQILHDIRITGTSSEIYEAISTAEGLQAWWPLRATGTAEMGAEYNFYFAEQYDWYAEVIACSFGQSISWKFTKADPDWIDTVLELTIKSGTETILTLSHSNWHQANDHFRRTSYCWATYLKLLKDYVEQGILIPHADRSIW